MSATLKVKTNKYIEADRKVLRRLAFSSLSNHYVSETFMYTRSVQYLISQQRLHDRTDAQTLCVSQESKTHFHGAIEYRDPDCVPASR